MQFVLFFTLNVYIFNPKKKKIIMQIIDTRITTLKKTTFEYFINSMSFMKNMY